MTQELFRVGQTEWWVLADTVTETIISQHKRSQVEADIAAIKKTLVQYPDPNVAEQDLQDIVWLVDNFKGATEEHKDRVKKLLRDMWAAYEQDPQMMERAELEARLERERQLLARMV